MDFNPDVLLEHLNADLNRATSTSIIDHFKMDMLLKSIVKKYVGGSNDSLHREAMTSFVAWNSQVADFRLNQSFRNGSVFRTWKTLLNDVFHSGTLQSCSLNLRQCIDYGKCGPGASIGAYTTSFMEKMFASELTSTDESLVGLYRHVIAGSRWARAEKKRSNLFATTVVKGSRLSSVPKDSTKNRTICIEPTLNMFFQLGAKYQIESVLKKRYCLDISTQADINRLLAQRSSVDGSKATIDLKNASDSISLVLCEELLPPDVFSVLKKIRSPEVSVDGVQHKLAMISTMGNGFTFPLMTLLLTTLVHAISIQANETCKNGVDFGVFGDDIIIKTSLVPELLRCLEESGFVVNTEKSFVAGPFRESCGGDFLLGREVRGVYIKEINDVTGVYSAFNRLHFWSLRHGINLTNTLTYLLGLARFQPVPGHAAVSEGFIVTREQLTSPKRDHNGAIYYKASVKKAVGLGAKRFRKLNLQGCLVSFLGGFMDGTRVRCRNATKLAVVKNRTPCWDHLTHPGVNHRDLDLSWRALLSAA